MSEFPNPCNAGGVYATPQHLRLLENGQNTWVTCPTCGRSVAVVGDRYSNHSRMEKR